MFLSRIGFLSFNVNIIGCDLPHNLTPRLTVKDPKRLVCNYLTVLAEASQSLCERRKWLIGTTKFYR